MQHSPLTARTPHGRLKACFPVVCVCGSCTALHCTALQCSALERYGRGAAKNAAVRNGLPAPARCGSGGATAHLAHAPSVLPSNVGCKLPLQCVSACAELLHHRRLHAQAQQCRHARGVADPVVHHRHYRSKAHDWKGRSHRGERGRIEHTRGHTLKGALVHAPPPTSASGRTRTQTVEETWMVRCPLPPHTGSV